MATTLTPGQWIRLRAYGGEVITRRIVAVERGHVYVTDDEEYSAAQVYGREPVCIGFRLDAVVSEGDGG